MSYDALVSAFADDRSPRRLVALPDGSVDRFYAVDGLDGDRLRSREAFGRQLYAGDGDSFSLDRSCVRPGGQAVNAARQWHRLGDDPLLVSHLDHPVLEDLPFETHSMGEPATIEVLSFDGENVLLSRDGRSGEWGVADLLKAVSWDSVIDADGIFCGNWVRYPGVTDVFERLAADGSRGTPVVFDPGPLAQTSGTDRDRLYEALANADGTVDVTMSVNRVECHTVAGDLGVLDGGRPDDVTPESLADVRSELGISAVAYHGTDRAVGATADAIVSVEMLDVGDPIGTTGAGDRFSGALASALARDWEWEAALALGNACAAQYVATAETATVEAIEARLGT